MQIHTALGFAQNSGTRFRIPPMHTETIEYAVGNAELEGYLAYDPTKPGKRPGVLVAHAWRGRDDFVAEKAEALAELGYVGFAADVYGRGLSGDTDEKALALMQPLLDDRSVLRARIGAAVHTLAEHDMVDPHHLGAIGFCFGGLTVLELARSGAAVRGVVSFHGLLGNPNPQDAKNIRCKVLALHGNDDPLAPPEDVDAFGKEMTQAGVDWQMIVYGNSMHAFTNPSADDPANGLQYNADADRRSWQAMRAFFDEIFS